MAQERIERIAERLKALVGSESQPYVHGVEKGAIVKFAEAIYDDRVEVGTVIKVDDREEIIVHIRKTPSGALIAPPTFLRSMKSGRFQEDLSVPLENVLDGGSEWEYFEPVLEGDRITVITRLAKVNLRETRLGKMLFLLWEIKYANQEGRLAAVQRATEIRY